MATLLYKWLLAFVLLHPATRLPADKPHPIFVSVTEIEHNTKDKTLEISCKLFTDDFEKTLRKHYTSKIDLLDEKQKAAMGTIVNDYIQKHLTIKVDGRNTPLQFIGFEQQEEGIMSFFQASNIAAVKKISVFNNLLYDYSEQQMGIIHVIVNGNRKSTRINNPESSASFEF